MSVKVVITDYIEPDLKWEEKELAQRGLPFTYHQLKFAPADQVIEATRDADVVVVNMVKITREVIAAWEKCRLVIRHGVGYDNVDVAALTEKGIPLCYIPDYCAEEVAEQAIALIFACARRIPASRKVLEESSARGQWDFADVIPMYRMAGRTLGILGCGRISYVRKLQSFGFNFLICDPYLSEAPSQAGIELVGKRSPRSDFITHTPLNDETRRIVNAETWR